MRIPALAFAARLARVLQLAIFTVAKKCRQLLTLLAAGKQRLRLHVRKRHPVVGSDVLGGGV